jgi:hypothetical protein
MAGNRLVLKRMDKLPMRNLLLRLTLFSVHTARSFPGPQA